VKSIKKLATPNFDDEVIAVEFVVLHYTAGTLERAIKLFMEEARQVSSHLIIDEDGIIIEVVDCWRNKCLRAWHAGRSEYNDGTRSWSEFNNISIGIELVNLNGNILAYTDEQYEALAFTMFQLKSIYPILNNPNRVLGHEHISGWRGKADPGRMFDWDRFYRLSYPAQPQPYPIRKAICPEPLQQSLQKFVNFVPTDADAATGFWHTLSHLTETCIKLLNEK
jgi:N-acetylmuramoyl-L-alanine amidase